MIVSKICSTLRQILQPVPLDQLSKQILFVQQQYQLPDLFLQCVQTDKY